MQVFLYQSISKCSAQFKGIDIIQKMKSKMNSRLFFGHQLLGQRLVETPSVIMNILIIDSMI